MDRSSPTLHWEPRYVCECICLKNHRDDYRCIDTEAGQLDGHRVCEPCLDALGHTPESVRIARIRAALDGLRELGVSEDALAPVEDWLADGAKAPS